jgi:hypothetical protein
VAEALQQLGLKLLSSFHLSVPERGEIPPSGLPASVLVAGVSGVLESDGWFPQPLRPDSMWTGALLERRGSDLWVHERHESGVGRLGPVRSESVGSVLEAIRRYVAANGGTSIDGVVIDWNA